LAISPDHVRLSLVVAQARNRGIGFRNGLLFRLRDDMAHFRSITAGKPVVMGRKTWDSFPKRPLPGRPNLVVTRQTDLMAPGAFVYADLAAAVAAARAMAAHMGIEEACIIGGADIFAATLPAADILWLTEVDAETEADVFFPAIDEQEWREASSRRVEKSEANEAAFVIRELVRRR
jgi:dihydrofolate reductase